MKNDSVLFFTCSLIEYIGKQRKQRGSAVVEYLGIETVKGIYKYADVFHCEPIEKIADEFITRCSIPANSFDNVAKCRYDVPDYWMILGVYKHLAKNIKDGVDSILEVYSSRINDVILNYNTDFYYQSREFICECYKKGQICA